ncbi:MAG: hypothetical protein LCH39_07070 [Proteobacteria bacterium]|nr:hypothetical protein [Pseudomonadota bacterium]
MKQPSLGNDWRLARTLAAITVAFWINGVCAQSTLPNISPGFTIFTNYCVSTLGSSTKAEQQFGDGNEIARRLPADFTTRMHGGVAGGQAWTLRPPKGERLLLDYHPKGICSIKFADLDPATVMSEFDIYIRTISQKLKSTSIDRSTETSQTHNTVRYKILTETRAYLFVISSAKNEKSETKAILSLMSRPR